MRRRPEHSHPVPFVRTLTYEAISETTSRDRQEVTSTRAVLGVRLPAAAGRDAGRPGPKHLRPFRLCDHRLPSHEGLPDSVGATVRAVSENFAIAIESRLLLPAVPSGRPEGTSRAGGRCGRGPWGRWRTSCAVWAPACRRRPGWNWIGGPEKGTEPIDTYEPSSPAGRSVVPIRPLLNPQTLSYQLLSISNCRR